MYVCGATDDKVNNEYASSRRAELCEKDERADNSANSANPADQCDSGKECKKLNGSDHWSKAAANFHFMHAEIAYKRTHWPASIKGPHAKTKTKAKKEINCEIAKKF